MALASPGVGKKAGAAVDLATRAQEMRAAFESRTGAFGPDDAWFETRSRAFWDDALTAQGFAMLAAPAAGNGIADVVRRWDRAHRGLFEVAEVDAQGALVVDAWSGAEFWISHLDETQLVTLEHMEGLMDGRVVTGPEEDGRIALFVLPGALHHPPDANEPVLRVLAAAGERGLSTGETLDALLRMERAFRSSSRVKAAFAYRVESLPSARRDALGATE